MVSKGLNLRKKEFTSTFLRRVNSFDASVKQAIFLTKFYIAPFSAPW